MTTQASEEIISIRIRYGVLHKKISIFQYKQYSEKCGNLQSRE